MINHMKLFWHKLNLRKNIALLDGCLDQNIREKLLNNIHHHEKSMIICREKSGK
ncbi:hypothetical protein QTG56_24590 (plasmid) [Rossellomorea sp. AcN35-11]|nr:hypothetical protein [Rossellomorea aquimaris]WJV31814.1 hypothetical protein QTG56_24590 [Rossellomorea sp. AcN35-11]